jgi:hypothetical protein
MGVKLGLSPEGKKEHRGKVAENKMLSSILGCKKEVTGGWRNLHIE